MYHRNYTAYLQKELDFLKLLVSRFHEQEKVNELELNIALQKMLEIYEQLLRIKLLPDQLDHEKPTLPKPEPQPQPVAVEPEKKIVKEAPPQQPPPPQSQPQQPPPPQPIHEEKKQPATSAKTEILAEKISPTDFHPINESLAQQKTGNDLSSKLQTAPLTSIVSGIGINDKFLFIRELFNGDNTLYNNAIQRLDTASSLTEAMDFICQQWDVKNETVQKLIHLVHRRHG